MRDAMRGKALLSPHPASRIPHPASRIPHTASPFPLLLRAKKDLKTMKLSRTKPVSEDVRKP